MLLNQFSFGVPALVKLRRHSWKPNKRRPALLGVGVVFVIDAAVCVVVKFVEFVPGIAVGAGVDCVVLMIDAALCVVKFVEFVAGIAVGAGVDCGVLVVVREAVVV